MILRSKDNDQTGGYSKVESDFLQTLVQDHPEFKFKLGSKFTFRPPKTIIVGPSEPYFKLLLLHELGHARLGHRDFDTDISRLKMEVAAWEEAKVLTSKYKVPWNEEVVQGELDTYRNWLHQKSRCPKCGLTRFETTDGTYHCPRCENLT